MFEKRLYRETFERNPSRKHSLQGKRRVGDPERIRQGREEGALKLVSDLRSETRTKQNKAIAESPWALEFRDWVIDD